MSKHDSTATPTPSKPAKPYPAFPLYPHAAGVWAKKIRGRTHYFGAWDDPDAALRLYMEQRDALHAGRTPRPDPEALTLKDVLNAFLNAKHEQVQHGEITLRTWLGYKEVANVVIAALGKKRLVIDLAPDDFMRLKSRMARRWGPVRLGNAIQNTRTIFKWGHEAGLFDHLVRFGPQFRRPTKKTLRIHRAQQGAKLFSAEEVRKLIDAAGQPLKAMILLGINCGLGNSDCGRLPRTALDLDGGWLDFPRPKTGIKRCCYLWPETIAALREALACRPAHKDPGDGRLVFVTKFGHCWHKATSESPIVKVFTILLSRLGIDRGRGFYALRHTFRTIADEAKDQPAADLIMGHESPHMSTVYRERIGDERLKVVSEHVRNWLLGAAVQ
jgi:integrase